MINKQIKAIVSSILFVSVMLLSICVFASAVPLAALNYGELIGNPARFEGTVSNNHIFHNTAGFTGGITSEESHTGSKAFMIDCHSVKNSGCMVETNYNLASVINNGRLYAELYVKGYEVCPDSISFYLYLIKNGTVLSYVPLNQSAESNGWHRIYAYAPDGDYDEIRFGVRYTYDADDGMDKLYVDDMTVRCIPVEITANDSFFNKREISADSLYIWGSDANGYKSRIYTTDLISYSVLNGNIEYDAEKRSFKSSDGNIAESDIEADFYGCKTVFKIRLYDKNNINIVDEIYRNDIYIAKISNSYDYDTDATVLVCIYDVGRLSSVQSYNIVLPANKVTSVSYPVQIPFYVSEPLVRAFIIKNEL